MHNGDGSGACNAVDKDKGSDHFRTNNADTTIPTNNILTAAAIAATATAIRKAHGATLRECNAACQRAE